MLRVCEQLSRRPCLHNLSGAHHCHSAGHHRQIVGDEEHGQPILTLQIFEQFQHLRLHGHIESGSRFVGDQQPRPVDQRRGDEDPLPLTARKLVRIIAVAARRLGQIDRFQRGDGLSFRFSARP